MRRYRGGSGPFVWSELLLFLAWVLALTLVGTLLLGLLLSATADGEPRTQRVQIRVLNAAWPCTEDEVLDRGRWPDGAWRCVNREEVSP